MNNIFFWNFRNFIKVDNKADQLIRTLCKHKLLGFQGPVILLFLISPEQVPIFVVLAIAKRKKQEENK